MIPISQITIDNRSRKIDDGPEFEILMESIKRSGLINPITVQEASTNSYELLCGARRTAACVKLGWLEIPATVLPLQDSKTRLMLELDENLRRKKFTWQELVGLKGKLYYTLLEQDDTYNQKRYSEELMQSEGLTSLELTLFDVRGEYPELFLIDSITKAFEELKNKKMRELLAERDKRSQAERYEEGYSGHGDSANFPISEGSQQPVSPPTITILDDALILLKNLKPGSVDCCITDPPFGIEIQKIKGRIGGTQIYDEEYSDSKSDYLILITKVIEGLNRVLKPGAHLYMLFSMTAYTELVSVLESVGFSVYPHPIIWVKAKNLNANITGNCPLPDFYPAMAYNPILFAFNEGKKRTLNFRGLPNVIACPTLNPANKLHPLEVPKELYRSLIFRSCMKGDTLVDPFCGTGNSLVAAAAFGCKIYGAEKVEEYRKVAEANVNRTLSLFHNGEENG